MLSIAITIITTLAPLVIFFGSYHIFIKNEMELKKLGLTLIKEGRGAEVPLEVINCLYLSGYIASKQVGTHNAIWAITKEGMTYLECT
jgi:hypothetical protein